MSDLMDFHLGPPRRNGFKMSQEGFQLDLREIFENTGTTPEKGCHYVIFKREYWPIIFLKLQFIFGL